MVAERDFIARLAATLATSPAARGFADDAAVWSPPLGRNLVFTHDVLAAGVHYRQADPPGDIAWKLLAVNLSDLAAMAARPAGVLLGLGLSAAEDDAWRDAFIAGLGRALAHFGVELWGGDTVSGLAQAVLGLTAIGHVEPGKALSRSGARPGDQLWVSGSIGDAGLGLDILEGRRSGPASLAKRYRLPMPRLALGNALAAQASAGMDVSDGLLIDADRLAAASGVGLALDLGLMPVSPAALGVLGDGLDARLHLATAGDDYELLFTAPPAVDVRGLAARAKTPVSCIGMVIAGAGLQLSCGGADVALPARLGWEH
jgi:thiamine-monophosphate kinase